jgi:hypothetical protein
VLMGTTSIACMNPAHIQALSLTTTCNADCGKVFLRRKPPIFAIRRDGLFSCLPNIAALFHFEVTFARQQ